MKKLLWILCALSVGFNHPAFGKTKDKPSTDEAIISLNGTQVTYMGKIKDKDVEHLMGIVKGKKVTTLVISSGGGEINEGMKIGEWVFDNKIDVVVERMCMSSCANYIFTAGNHKTIRPNSIVAWHGNISNNANVYDEEVRNAAMDSYAQLSVTEKEKINSDVFVNQTIEKMREYQATSVAHQTQFFEKIGINERICRVGNETYGAKDFFLLSVKDMAQFGVLNVEAPEDYKEIDLTPFQQTGKSVEFISLN